MFVLVDSLSKQRLCFSFVHATWVAWIWVIARNCLLVLCKVYIPENKRITCGLLEMLQSEKSYAGMDTTFSLKQGIFSDLFSFRYFHSPFKAWACGLLALSQVGMKAGTSYSSGE